MRQRLRKVYILPNLFTSFNLAMGAWAILAAFQGQIERACWYLVIAGVLDGLDGPVARLTRTQSEFGLQFDSLADLVSFGVAPAVTFFALMHPLAGVHGRLLEGACLLYAVCAALRLARYNVQARSTERRGFLGLPSPGAAGAVIFLVLAILQYDLHRPGRVVELPGGWTLAPHGLLVEVLPFVILALALLMVSGLPYPKILRALRLRRSMPFESLVTLILVAVLIVALQSDLRVLILFVLVWAYVLYGMIALPLRRLRGHVGESPTPASGDQNHARG